MLVGDRVIISGKAGDVVSVRAYAAKTGYSDSEVGYYSYSISSYEGGIFADKETGSIVKNGEIIHLSSDVSGADDPLHDRWFNSQREQFRRKRSDDHRNTG